MKNDKKANIGLMTALFLYQMIIDKAIQGLLVLTKEGNVHYIALGLSGVLFFVCVFV